MGAVVVFTDFSLIFLLVFFSFSLCGRKRERVERGCAGVGSRAPDGCERVLGTRDGVASAWWDCVGHGGLATSGHGNPVRGLPCAEPSRVVRVLISDPPLCICAREGVAVRPRGRWVHGCFGCVARGCGGGGGWGEVL